MCRRERVAEFGTLGDDGSAADLEVIGERREGGVGPEEHEHVPRQSCTGVELAIAVTEPRTDLQVGIGDLDYPGVIEDGLRLVAEAVATDCLPDGDDPYIGVGVLAQDVVGHPTGALNAGASSG